MKIPIKKFKLTGYDKTAGLTAPDSYYHRIKLKKLTFILGIIPYYKTIDSIYCGCWQREECTKKMLSEYINFN